jgi:hypothetical protein
MKPYLIALLIPWRPSVLNSPYQGLAIGVLLICASTLLSVTAFADGPKLAHVITGRERKPR